MEPTANSQPLTAGVASQFARNGKGQPFSFKKWNFDITLGLSKPTPGRQQQKFQWQCHWHNQRADHSQKHNSLQRPLCHAVQKVSKRHQILHTIEAAEG